jgi:SAM-dependent methyltransferase
MEEGLSMVAAMSHSYRYPDPGDRVTAGAIRAVGVDEAELRRQETEVLDKFEKRLGIAHRHKLLDYGSGEGRLSGHFAALFEYVVAYEPDDDRRASHAQLASRDSKVELLATFDRLAQASSFDAAICSHVIQHVSRDEAEVVLGDLAAALRQGGALLLLTTSTGLTWEDKPRFFVSKLSTAGEAVESEVNAVEFDAAFRRNTPGELPIHFYGKRELLHGLTKHGFVDLQAYGLHGNAGVVGLYNADAAPFRPGGVGQDGVPLHARDVAVMAIRE